MIVAGSASPLLLASAGYNLQRSLRFRSSASAYLNRTPATASNRKTWTWSGWVKRGSVTSQPQIIFVGGQSGVFTDSSQLNIQFNTSDQILIQTGATNLRLTTQVFRDPSSWYHIVLNVDTTQATAANRLKLYINGLEVTSFATNNNVAQNTDLGINQTQLHTIYSGFGLANTFFDGYLTEVNFIDGQALTPSSFGQTSPSTGVWQPKKYVGTYGTNGFYLPFTNIASTTTLGNDFSGNGNNWTTNNISLTAGTTYDSMTDVPTLTSATASNFSVLNPLNRSYSTYTISDGNLGWTSSTVNMGAFGTMQLPTSGKYYWEIVMTASAGGNPFIGLGPANDSLGNIGLFYRTGGGKEQYGGVTGNGAFSYGATWTTNDVIGVAYDADTSGGQVTFYKNNATQGVAFSSLLTNFPNGLFPAFQNNASGTTTFNANFGQRPFTYTPPTGFVALNTFNLPTPTIGATASTQANKYFDATTYTGNGSTQTITNAGGFQPDFVWVKNRATTTWNSLQDSVRGATKELYSNSTDAEQTYANTLTSFNSNGFSVGNAAGNNGNGNGLVAWQWNAGGSTVTNTSGSISSQVRANPSAGFSVVTYTGNGSSGSVGHGLGVAPKIVLIKNRTTGSTNWIFFTTIVDGSMDYLFLNTTAAKDNAGESVPTSTTFNLASSSSNINASSNNYVAYCFSEVAGYSRFGSYTGNGSTDGTFVYTGFRPKFVMIKQSSSSGAAWVIYDTARGIINPTNIELYPTLSNAESSGSNFIDILSNGFKLRSTQTYANGSGETYIYMAFCESPFKFANAR